MEYRQQFCKFRASQVLNVLMSGSTLSRRDMEVEFVNKSMILRSGGHSMTRRAPKRLPRLSMHLRKVTYPVTTSSDRRTLQSDLLYVYCQSIQQIVEYSPGSNARYHVQTKKEPCKWWCYFTTRRRTISLRNRLHWKVENKWRRQCITYWEKRGQKRRQT